MSPIKIGFLGFGEVASTLSKPLREHGAQVAAYDILLSQEGGKAILQRRAQDPGIVFLSLPALISHADYLLSTVTTQMATQVAQECAPYLKPGQVYLDLNSTSPAVKITISQIVEATGADFVEGAILGAVGISGARTAILTAGARGKEVAERLTSLGLRVSYYRPEIGKASLFKMLRSIFSKGVEALLLEMLLAGKRAGIARDLWREINELLSQNRFEQVAANWIQSHAVAYERRYHEMVQVSETMREIGVEPVMTAGTIAFFRRSLRLDWETAFREKPTSMDQVIDFLVEQLQSEV
ncbi:MAG: NAD(P)-dependent oxidoreductase [Nitrospinota bacterium]|nr:MAG: NAD(P)-dependent oxidoreductase [Nitrospinota bacterium]